MVATIGNAITLFSGPMILGLWFTIPTPTPTPDPDKKIKNNVGLSLFGVGVGVGIGIGFLPRHIPCFASCRGSPTVITGGFATVQTFMAALIAIASIEKKIFHFLSACICVYLWLKI